MAGGAAAAHPNGNGVPWKLVDVDAITIGPARRDVGDVHSLADSINDLGLLNPITLSRKMRLIAGGRRLAAVKTLDWAEVPAIIVDLADLRAELAEIDENLIRNELTVLQRAEQLRRRKEIYEALHPKAVQHAAGANGTNKKLGKNHASDNLSFASAVATKTRVSERTVQRAVEIAESLSPETKEVIAATPVADIQSELLKLSRAEPSKQLAAAKAIAAGKAKTVASALLGAERAERARSLSSRPRPPVDHRLVLGDSIEEMNKLDAGCATVVFADPPYNNGWRYDGDPTRDELSDDEYLAWCKTWMKAAARLLTPNGSLFVLIDDNYSDPFGMLLRKTGLHRRNTIVWWEHFPVHTPGNFSKAARFLHYYTKGADGFIWNKEDILVPSGRNKCNDKRGADGGKVPDNVWQIIRVPGNAIDRVPFDNIPPQIPDELPQRCIRAASNPGDLVVDPFNGNGTSGRAALLEGRRYIGIDRSRLYIRQAEQWIQAALTGAVKEAS